MGHFRNRKKISFIKYPLISLRRIFYIFNYILYLTAVPLVFSKWDTFVTLQRKKISFIKYPVISLRRIFYIYNYILHLLQTWST